MHFVEGETYTSSQSIVPDITAVKNEVYGIAPAQMKKLLHIEDSWATFVAMGTASALSKLLRFNNSPRGLELVCTDTVGRPYYGALDDGTALLGDVAQDVHLLIHKALAILHRLS